MAKDLYHSDPRLYDYLAGVEYVNMDARNKKGEMDRVMRQQRQMARVECS